MPPRGFSETQKPRDWKNVVRRLMNYMRPQAGPLLLAALMILLSNVASLAGPKLSGAAIDAMGMKAGEADMDHVLQNALLMLGAYIVAAILTWTANRLMIKTTQKIAYRMRQDAFNKIVELPLAYIDSHSTGDLISRISYDIDVVNQSLTNDVIGLISASVTVVGSISMMISINGWLTLIFLTMVPITILQTRYRLRVTRPLFSRRSKKLGELNGFVEETISGQKTIRSYAREAVFIDRFDHENNDAIDYYYEADYKGAVNGPTVTMITNLGLAVISMFGGIFYLMHRISVGDLSSFVLYSRRFAGPVNEVAMMTGELQSAASAAERLFALLDQPSEPADAPGAEDLRDIRGEVELNEVRFEYVEDVPVIRDLNLRAPAGSLTAIVGPTGAGKTTLINLLMRFYDPQKGVISIDGHPIAEVTRRSLRRAYAMVLQDAWLFEGTIRENIAYGRPDASQEEIERVAKAAHIHRFIEQQPEGYDTIISDGATNVSQGQMQLITIARAMLMDAPMLILDEATSNVDSRTEQSIQDAMNQLMKGRTSFVIAHRLSTIRNADRILVVNDGQIVEQGTHDELLEAEGFYASLYNAQFT